MDLEGLDLGQICRTCKCVTSQMRSLFEGYENPHESPRIDEMLMACASIQVNIIRLQQKYLKNSFGHAYFFTGDRRGRFTVSNLPNMCGPAEKCFCFQAPVRKNRCKFKRIRKKRKS